MDPITEASSTSDPHPSPARQSAEISSPYMPPSDLRPTLLPLGRSSDQPLSSPRLERSSDPRPTPPRPGRSSDQHLSSPRLERCSDPTRHSVDEKTRSHGHTARDRSTSDPTSENLSPQQRALLHNPLYQQIRTRAIADIESYLKDKEHHNPSSHHHHRHHHDHNPEQAMADTENYLTDAQYYNPSHHHHTGVHQPHSDDLPTHEPKLAETESDMTEYDEDFNKVTWGDMFSPTYVTFIYHAISESFYNNPYKLHPGIYCSLGASLLWAIGIKWWICLDGLLNLRQGTPVEESWLEGREMLDKTVSILPLLVQFVLFLFPPLLASGTS